MCVPGFFKFGSYSILLFRRKVMVFDRCFDHSLRIERSFISVTGQQNPVRLYIIVSKLKKYESSYDKVYLLNINFRFGLVIAKLVPVKIH